jgi:hypothetical protein
MDHNDVDSYAGESCRWALKGHFSHEIVTICIPA